MLSFLKRITTKPPMIFPWVALFHLLMLGYSLFMNMGTAFPVAEWAETGWALGFFLSWLLVCDLRRWAAIVYILLMLSNLAVRFLLPGINDGIIYSFGLFEITLFCSFLILFYFRRFS